MGIDVNGSSTDLQLWHVELADGVRTMSVLDLADAFRAGVIQLATRVKKTQDPRWVAFGSVAGRLADEEPGPRSERVRSTYPPISVERHRHHSSIPPMATDVAPPPSFPPPPLALRVSYPSNSTERMPAAPASRHSEYWMRGAVFAAVLLCALVGGFLTAKATNARSFGHRTPATKAALAPPAAPPPAVTSLPEPSETAPVPPPPPTGTIVPAPAGSAEPSLDAKRAKKKPLKKPAKP